MLYDWLPPDDEANVNKFRYLPTPDEIPIRAAEARKATLEAMKNCDEPERVRVYETRVCPKCRKVKSKKNFRCQVCNNCYKKRAVQCS